MSNKRQHTLSLIMLSATAIIWGGGFLLSDILLDNGFGGIPFSLNTLRFMFAMVLLAGVFCKQIRFNKTVIIYGVIGGVLLFFGFELQLLGLKYTTPAFCGFFTASYVLFVPFLTWIVKKKRPTLPVIFGVVAAMAGLAILNIKKDDPQGSNELLGNMLTLGSALAFGMQIVMTDKALGDERVGSVSLIIAQMIFTVTLFALCALIFEVKEYKNVHIDWAKCWWPLAIISVLGTAFAYFSQTFAQVHSDPSAISIILACESPVGAVLSVAVGAEKFTWQLAVGGVLIILAVILVEVVPTLLEKRRKAKAAEQSDNENQPTEE